MPLAVLSDKITDYLQTTLAGDTTIKTLTGGGPSDPRVYHYYDAPAETPIGFPAYLSWAQMSMGREVNGVTEPVVSIRTYSYDVERVYDIEIRITQLFDKVVHTITGVGRTVTEVINQQDLYDQTNKFCGRETHIKFGALTTAQ